MFLHRVKDENCVRGFLHGAKSTEVALQLCELTVEKERLFFDHEIEFADLLLSLKFEHLVHSKGDGAKVGQHATEPTLVDIRHSTAVSCLANGILCLLLRSDEQDVSAIGCKIAKEVVGGLDPVERLVEVDDVNTIAFAKDESTHLRVPTTGLVAEMRTCLNHLTHADESHESLLWGCGWSSNQGAEATAVGLNISNLE